MAARDPDPDFVEADLTPGEREELVDIARRLERRRPVPDPAFRGDLRRTLIDTGVEAPGRIRPVIAAYAGSGLILLAVVAIGIAGAGPLAAG